MRGRLIALLDSYEYYKADDGAYYTPKQDFINDYEAIVTDANGYFKEIEQDLIIDTSGDNLVTDMREIFAENGGGEAGAYAVIKNSLELLEGGTVELKQKQTKIKEVCRNTTGIEHQKSLAVIAL